LIIEQNREEQSLVIHVIAAFYEKMKQNPENVATLLDVSFCVSIKRWCIAE